MSDLKMQSPLYDRLELSWIGGTALCFSCKWYVLPGARMDKKSYRRLFLVHRVNNLKIISSWASNHYGLRGQDRYTEDARGVSRPGLFALSRPVPGANCAVGSFAWHKVLGCTPRIYDITYDVQASLFIMVQPVARPETHLRHSPRSIEARWHGR